MIYLKITLGNIVTKQLEAFKLARGFYAFKWSWNIEDISLPYVNRYSCLLSSLVNCYTSIKYEINTGIY